MKARRGDSATDTLEDQVGEIAGDEDEEDTAGLEGSLGSLVL